MDDKSSGLIYEQPEKDSGNSHAVIQLKKKR
jgi:hypothetical protein